MSSRLQTAASQHAYVHGSVGITATYFAFYLGSHKFLHGWRPYDEVRQQRIQPTSKLFKLFSKSPLALANKEGEK